MLCNNAPLTSPATLATQNLVSFSRKISPFRPKQKFATPPGTTILPIRVPDAFQTFSPSPQPEQTFPCRSHLMPSGMPVSAKAKSRRLARNVPPDLFTTSNAYLDPSSQQSADHLRHRYSHARNPRVVRAAVAVNPVRVGDIQRLLVGRKGQTVWSSKAVGDCANVATGWIVPI